MKSFTKLPNKILYFVKEKKINAADVLVLFAIMSHRNQKTGECYPSTRRLSRLTGLSLSTIVKGIKRLKKCSIIWNTYQHGKTSNYRYIFDEASVPNHTQKVFRILEPNKTKYYEQKKLQKKWVKITDKEGNEFMRLENAKNDVKINVIDDD